MGRHPAPPCLLCVDVSLMGRLASFRTNTGFLGPVMRWRFDQPHPAHLLDSAGLSADIQGASGSGLHV
jgi:hypothetical protein